MPYQVRDKVCEAGLGNLWPSREMESRGRKSSAGSWKVGFEKPSIKTGVSMPCSCARELAHLERVVECVGVCARVHACSRAYRENHGWQHDQAWWHCVLLGGFQTRIWVLEQENVRRSCGSGKTGKRHGRVVLVMARCVEVRDPANCVGWNESWTGHGHETQGWSRGCAESRDTSR